MIICSVETVIFRVEHACSVLALMDMAHFCVSPGICTVYKYYVSVYSLSAHLSVLY